MNSLSKLEIVVERVHDSAASDLVKKQSKAGKVCFGSWFKSIVVALLIWASDEAASNVTRNV